MCNAAPGNEIRGRLFELAGLVLRFDLEEYLRQQEKVLFGIVIEEGRCAPLFGDPPANVIEEANRHFLNCKAGYRVNGTTRYPAIEPNADLFLLSTDLVQGQRETVDALIIHELCHLVDQSEYTRDGMLCPVSADDAMVVTLHRAFDQWEGPLSIHSVEFCSWLVAAAASAVEAGIGFRDQADAIALAVQYETARVSMPDWFDEEGRIRLRRP